MMEKLTITLHGKEGYSTLIDRLDIGDILGYRVAFQDIVNDILTTLFKVTDVLSDDMDAHIDQVYGSVEMFGSEISLLDMTHSLYEMRSYLYDWIVESYIEEKAREIVEDIEEDGTAIVTGKGYEYLAFEIEEVEENE